MLLFKSLIKVDDLKMKKVVTDLLCFLIEASVKTEGFDEVSLLYLFLIGGKFNNNESKSNNLKVNR